MRGYRGTMGTSEEYGRTDFLMRVMGMLHDKVRVYQIAEDREVQRDEFQYCQVMWNIVFGDRGFAETLGPTWRMVHDPRFQEIEALMIVDRHAIFGGDARLGKQYIGDDGSFSSTVSDLEKYAEILGEGRNFHNVLVHPDPDCVERLWLERIYRGYTHIRPGPGFGCTCKGAGTDPSSFKDAPDGDVWALIGGECPNRGFNRDGTPNAYGRLMHSLIRADLVGLVADYAETPLIDSYVYLRDHGLVTQTEAVDTGDPHGQEAPRVLQEVDILEQALTHRATMRATAYKLLRQSGIDRQIRAAAGDLDLTDVERDELLRLVYEDDYPEREPELTYRARLDAWTKAMAGRLLGFAGECAAAPLAERRDRQLAAVRAEAWRTIDGLKTGAVAPINEYTEPAAEMPAAEGEDEVMRYASLMEAIMANEFKQELYLVLVEAEKQGDTAAVDILTPVFLDPGYELDERGFYNILERIRIGSRSLRAERLDAIRGVKESGLGLDPAREMTEVEGEFHAKDSPYR